jgi:hypothetical protein
MAYRAGDMCRVRLLLSTILLRRRFRPIRWRQWNSPDILRMIEFDSAALRIGRVDIRHARSGAFPSQKDLDRNFQALHEGNRRRQQSPVQIDDNRLAFAGEVFSAAVHADDNAQGHTRTSSGFPKRVRGRAAHFSGRYPATSRVGLATLNVTPSIYSRNGKERRVVQTP